MANQSPTIAITIPTGVAAGAAVAVTGMGVKTVQVVGPFSAGTTTLQGSTDEAGPAPANFVNIAPGGTFTAAGYVTFSDNFKWLRFNTTGAITGPPTAQLVGLYSPQSS